MLGRTERGGGGVDNGIVEYWCSIDTTSRDDYTNGVDVHTGDNWIIRHNLFRNIRAPQGQLAGPAILMWNGSTNTLVDGNTFVNCQREIALGLIERTPNDHSVGIVRNNFIYRSVAGDSAIYVADSPNTQVLHNSIFISGTYANPIEYRFPHTTGTVVANNILDGTIAVRDGATGSIAGNFTTATAALFVNPATGDLHLKATASAVLNKVASPHAAAGFDWDGQPRLAGSTDIGADEFVTGADGADRSNEPAGDQTVLIFCVSSLALLLRFKTFVISVFCSPSCPSSPSEDHFRTSSLQIPSPASSPSSPRGVVFGYPATSCARYLFG